MAETSLVDRVRDHLARQGAWLEDVVLELGRVRFDEEDFMEAARALDRRVNERIQWESAQAQLLAEWHAAARVASEAERADIQARAGRVRELARQAGDAYRRLAEQVETHKQRVGESLAQLGRGREFLRRQYVDNNAGWSMDWKA